MRSAAIALVGLFDGVSISILIPAMKRWLSLMVVVTFRKSWATMRVSGSADLARFISTPRVARLQGYQSAFSFKWVLLSSLIN